MRLSLVLALFVCLAVAQPPLQQQIRNIAADAHARVSVACSLSGTPMNCDVDAESHPPMQSVFKLPLALTILHQVEEGKFSLNQSIRFQPEDLILPNHIAHCKTNTHRQVSTYRCELYCR